MNEFDFQSGDFLDTLYVPSDAPLTTDSSTVPSATGLGSYGTSYTSGGGGFFDHPAGVATTASVSQAPNPVTTATTTTDFKATQSFPPNFYADISYDPHPGNDQKNGNETSSAAGHETNQLEPSSQQQQAEAQESQEVVPTEPEPEIEIAINNVVCSFAVRCHLNLRKVATEGVNVIYKRAHGMVSMKLRRPRTTASLWSSGKITCTGATSEEDAKKAARRIARILQKMGFRVRLTNFRVVNVLGTCTFPFGIRITTFSADHKEASYEPELHPGVTYKIKEPKATLKIFSTGSITVTAPRVQNVQAAIEHIYPLVSPYRMEKRAPGGGPVRSREVAQGRGPEVLHSKMHLMPTNRSRPGPGRFRRQHRDEDDFDSEVESSEGDSDTSEEDY